jgi:hypothetical protein
MLTLICTVALFLSPRVPSYEQAREDQAKSTTIRLRLVAEIRDASKRPLSAAPVVKTSTIFGDADLFSRLTGAVERDGALIVGDSRTSPHLFRFSTKSGALTHSGARQGRGPGEVIYPASLLLSPDGTEIGVFDFNLRRLLWFSAASLKSTGRILSLGDVGSLAGILHNGSDFLANPISPDVSLVKILANGTVSDSYSLQLPFGPPQVSDLTARRLLNVSVLSTDRPLASKAVLAYQMIGALDIVDLASRTFVRVHGPRPVKVAFRFVPPSGRFKWEDESENAYVGVASTPTRIYALFSGSRDDERRYGARYVHVFDWQGRFFGEFSLDRDASFLAVTHDRLGLLFGTDTPFPSVARALIPHQYR